MNEEASVALLVVFCADMESKSFNNQTKASTLVKVFGSFRVLSAVLNYEKASEDQWNIFRCT